jgi:hypothetical protein
MGGGHDPLANIALTFKGRAGPGHQGLEQCGLAASIRADQRDRAREVLAQSLEERAICEAVIRPAHANPQAGARSRRRGSYQNVSRETFLSDRAGKSYKASDSGPFFNHVRSINFLVQFQKRGGGASMA